MQMGYTVTRLLANAAYDKLDNWKLCRSFGIDFIINISSPLLGSTCETGAYAQMAYLKGRRTSAESERWIAKPNSPDLDRSTWE